MPSKSERRASGAPDRRQPASSPQDTRQDDTSSASRSGSGRNRSGTIRGNTDIEDDFRPRRESERRKVESRDDKRAPIEDYENRGEDTRSSKERDRLGYEPYMPMTGDQAHLPDQFPGQVPQEYSLPYRPPPTTRTDSYGEASKYYGDEGQSVQHQPGVRPGTPIVVGAEPHLLAASATAAPAQDTGNGAAAEFYGKNTTSGPPKTSPPYDARPPLYPPSNAGAQPGALQRPIPHSSQSEPAPSYAVPLALGAAGSVAAEMIHHEVKIEEYTDATQPQSSSGRPRPYRPTTVGSSSNVATIQPHRPQHNHHHSPRRRGTLGRFVDWWNDHEGVEKMETYTQYIGVCRDCFDPHTSAVEAPRRHHYRRRVNAEHRHRVDKDSRYSSSSSDSESSRRRHSTRRRHSPRLERRSSDRMSSTSYGLVEIDRRSTETQHFEERSNDRTSSRAEYDRISSHDNTNGIQGRNPSHHENDFRSTTPRTHAEYSPERRDQGFFSSFFSPSSNSRRRDRARQDEAIEVDLEADTYENSSHSKRKRGQGSHATTTANATEALIGLSAATAALAAAGGRGSHAAARPQASRSRHHKSEGHRRSRSEDSWESASLSDESSSIHSALAFGDYEVEPPRKRRTSQESESSQSSDTGKWSRRRDERRSSRNSRSEEGHTEVLFDREDDRESWNDHSDFQESRQRPLQNLDPRPMSPSSETALHNHGRDTRLYQPQPVSPPKAFSTFESAEHGSRPQIYHAQSAPTPLAYTSKNSYARERWQENIRISENVGSEASSSRDTKETDQGRREASQLNEKTRNAVTTVAASARAGAAIGVLAKTGQRKERKASVRFAGIDSEEEDVTTAQHHSQPERRESISDAPTTSETPWREVKNEFSYDTPRKSSTVLADVEKIYSSPTFKDFSANDHRDYHEPILDDDVDDRDFFKRSSSTRDVPQRSSAEKTNSHAYEEPILTDKQEKEADDYVTRLEKRYSPESFAVSQADFFRPVLEQTLSNEGPVLDRRLDESADETVQPYDGSNDRPPFMRQSSVPTLRIIAATPPPELVKQRKLGARSSRLQYSDTQDSPEFDIIDGVEAEGEESSNPLSNRSEARSQKFQPSPLATMEDFREEDDFQEDDSAELSTSGQKTRGEMRTEDDFETNVTSNGYANETLDEAIERKTPGGFIDEEQETTEELGRSGVTTSDYVSSAPRPVAEDWEPSPKVDIGTYPVVKSPKSSYAALTHRPPQFVRHQFPGIEESVCPIVSATGTMLEKLPNLVREPRIQQPIPSNIIAVPYSPPLANQTRPDSMSSPSSQSFGLTSPRDDPRRLSANLAFQEHSDAIPELTPLPESRPNSPYSDKAESPLVSPRHPDGTPLRRHSHTSTPSTTAIPLRFLRHAQSPSWSRSSPFDMASVTPSSPIATPQSPNTPLRPKARPSSGEFKTWHEFRPLYLVERNAKSHDSDELLETLPSLPSSTTGSMFGSRASSVRDGGDGEDDFVSATQSPAGSMLADEPGDGYLEQANYFDRFDDASNEDVKYLDSQQATPKAVISDAIGGDDEIPDLSIADDTILHHEISVPDTDTISSPTPVEDEDDLPFETPMEKIVTPDLPHDREAASVAGILDGGEATQSQGKLGSQRPSILGLGLVTASAAVAAIAADVVKRATGTQPHDPISSDDRGLDSTDVEPQASHAQEQDEEELWPVKALSKKDKKKAKKNGRKTIEEPEARSLPMELIVDDTETIPALETLPAAPLPESDDPKAIGSEPTDEPPDWSFTSTSKKDKRKGKKSKSLPFTTPASAPAEDDYSIVEPAIPEASTELVDKHMEDAIQPAPSSSSAPDIFEPETPEPESFWEGTFTSKKDKKKAKKQAKQATQSRLPVATPDEVDELVVEPESPAKSTESSRTPFEDMAQPTPSSSGIPGEVVLEKAEPELFWEGSFMSKKDKKKAKKQGKQATLARLPQSARVVDNAQIYEIAKPEVVRAHDVDVMDGSSPETIALPAGDDTDLETSLIHEITSNADSFRVQSRSGTRLLEHDVYDRDARNLSPQDIALPTSDPDEARALAEPIPQDVPLPISEPGEMKSLASPKPQDIPLPISHADETISLAEPIPQDVPLPISDFDEARTLAGDIRSLTLGESDVDDQHKIASLQYEHGRSDERRASPQQEELAPELTTLPDTDTYDFTALISSPLASRPSARSQADFELYTRAPEDIVLPEDNDDELQNVSQGTQREHETSATSSNNEDHFQTASSLQGAQETAPEVSKIAEHVALPQIDAAEVQALVGEASPFNVAEDVPLSEIDASELRALGRGTSISKIAEDVALPEIDDTEVHALAERRSIDLNASSEPVLPQNMGTPELGYPVAFSNELSNTRVSSPELSISNRAKHNLLPSRSADLDSISIPIPAPKDTRAPTIDDKLPQEAADDEWFLPSAKTKKGKKGKKGRKAFEEEELEPSSILEEPVFQRDATQNEDAAANADASTTINLEAAADDEWAFPAQLKKGKKVKKQWNTSKDEDTTPVNDERLPETFSQDEPSQSEMMELKDQEAAFSVDVRTHASLDAPPAAAHPDDRGFLFDASQPIEAGEDDWAFPATTKKGKKGKKAKNSALVTADQPASTEPSMTDNLSTNDKNVYDEATLRSIEVADTTAPTESQLSEMEAGLLSGQLPRSRTDKAVGGADTALASTFDDVTSRPIEEQEGIVPSISEAAVDRIEEEWAYPISTKKSKKGKKGKKPWEEIEASTQSQFTSDTPVAQDSKAPEQVVETSKPSQSVNLAERSLAQEASTDTQNEMSGLPTPTAKEAAPAEDEWDFPILTKKGKRGKKATKSAWTDEELPTQGQATVVAGQATDRMTEKDDVGVSLPSTHDAERLPHVAHPAVDIEFTDYQHEGLDKIESASLDPTSETAKLDPVDHGWAFPVTIGKDEDTTKSASIEKDALVPAQVPATSEHADVPVPQSDRMAAVTTPFADDETRLLEIAERGVLDVPAESSTVIPETSEQPRSVPLSPTADIVNTDPAEDEWAFPITTKKSKKGKKNKLDTASIDQAHIMLDSSSPVRADTAIAPLSQPPAAKEDEDDQWLAPAKKGKKAKKSKDRGTPFTWIPEVEETDEPIPAPKVEEKDEPILMPELVEKDEPTPTPEGEVGSERTPITAPARDSTSSEHFIVPGAFLPESPPANVIAAPRDLETDFRTGPSAPAYLEDDHSASSQEAEVPEHIDANAENNKHARSQDEATPTNVSSYHNIVGHSVKQQSTPEEIALPPSPFLAMRYDSVDETAPHVEAERDEASTRGETTSPSFSEARVPHKSSEHISLPDTPKNDPEQTHKDEEARSLTNQSLRPLDPDTQQNVRGEQAHAIDAVKTPDWDPSYITQWATIADTVTINDPDHSVPHNNAETLPGIDEPKDWSKQLHRQQEPTQDESTAKEPVWKEMSAITSPATVLHRQEVKDYPLRTEQDMSAPPNLTQDVIEEEPEPWAFTMKSKKGKKGKKNQAVTKPAETRQVTRDGEESALVAMEAGGLRPDTTISDAHDRGEVFDTEVAKSQEMLARADLAQDVIEEEPDPWAFTVKSKKNKKGKKNQTVAKASRNTNDEEVSALVAAEAGEIRPDTTASDVFDECGPLDITSERGRQLVQKEQSTSDVPVVGDFATIVASPAPIDDKTEHSAAYGQEAQTQTQPQGNFRDDGWDQSFRSQDKKKQKGKDEEVDMLTPVLDKQYQHASTRPDDPESLPAQHIGALMNTAPNDDFWASSFTSKKKNKKGKNKDKDADVFPPAQDEQYTQGTPRLMDPESLRVPLVENSAEPAPDDDFWGSSFKSQKKNKKGKKEKVLDTVVAGGARDDSELAEVASDAMTKETDMKVPPSLPPSALESGSMQALESEQTSVPEDDFKLYSQSQKRKGKKNRGRTIDFETLPFDPATPVTNEPQISSATLAPPEAPSTKMSWADEMEALDAAEQGSAGVSQHRHHEIESQPLSSRHIAGAGNLLDTAEAFTVDNRAEASENAETSTVANTAMETVNRFGAAEDNNTTTSLNNFVQYEPRTADAVGTETKSFEIADTQPPESLQATKMSKRDRKKAEKARRKEEAAYMGEDWWMGTTPVELPVQLQRAAEKTDKADMHSRNAHDVEVQSPGPQNKEPSNASTADSPDAQTSDQTSSFDAALAATLGNAGFDRSLLAREQLHDLHDLHEYQATGSALDEDEDAARHRAESRERRRSRRSSSQSQHSVSKRKENAVREGDGKTVAASFEEVVASTLAMAGFDAGHLGTEKQPRIGDTGHDEEEVTAMNEPSTATGHMWNTGAKILGFLGGGAVVGKSSRSEAHSVTDDDVVQRDGMETGTREEEIGHTRGVGDFAVEDEMHVETVASAIQETASIKDSAHQSPVVTASRSFPAKSNTMFSRDGREHDDSITDHEQPVTATTWSFDNIKPFHDPPQSPEDTARARLRTIPELEQAQKAHDHEGIQVLEQPFSAQATAARIFSNPRSPRTSFVASMRTPQGNAIQSVHVHRQRLPSGAGPETANTHRQAVRQERRDISPAEYLSPYHSPTASNVSIGSAPRSITPILRRTDRKLSGDLRALSRGSRDGEEAQVSSELSLKPKSVVGGLTTSAVGERSDVDKIYDPLRGSGSGRMSEVSISQQQQHEEWRDMRGSSPRAPPSLYRKQSRQILELESHIAHLSAENQALQQSSRSRSRQDDREFALQAKDVEISQLRAKLSVLREDTARLHEHNSQLEAANRNLSEDTNERYATLQAEHADVHTQLESTTADLARLRETHARTASGIESAISTQISAALSSKDAEIAGLKAELKRREIELSALQQQLLALQNERENESDAYLHPRNIDYFDSACHQLFSHISAWILRFSKFSDTRSCILTSLLTDDKLLARLDTALLDGSDVDTLLADRVRRRDVFMSVAVGMLWEYIFTRYLFGLERSQRQRLKTLERTLSQVGPARAVASWRATTLTLLSRLPSFEAQRKQDADAVVAEILLSLSTLLPPPEHLVEQLRQSLDKIVNLAVGLAVEMRCQKSEYIMLPPLHPEFDRDGELVRTVRYNSSLMTARDGSAREDDGGEEGGVVQLVLFPLVVKKGDEAGDGDEEIVVCPAQVVLARNQYSTSHQHHEHQHQEGPPRKVVRVLSSGVVMDGRHALTEGWEQGEMSDISGIGGGSAMAVE